MEGWKLALIAALLLVTAVPVGIVFADFVVVIDYRAEVTKWHWAHGVGPAMLKDDKGHGTRYYVTTVSEPILIPRCVVGKEVDHIGEATYWWRRSSWVSYAVAEYYTEYQRFKSSTTMWYDHSFYVWTDNSRENLKWGERHSGTVSGAVDDAPPHYAEKKIASWGRDDPYTVPSGPGDVWGNTVSSNDVTVYGVGAYMYNGGFTYVRIPASSEPPSYTLTIQIYRATASGTTPEPANGTKVRIGSAEYTADSNGKVQVTLQQGSYSVEVLTTYYGPSLTVGGVSTSWRRYRFWKWSDDSTDNPRTISLSSNMQLTAYVWDERLLLVWWEPAGDAWGVVNATSGVRLSYNAMVWLPRGRSFQLLPVEGGGMVFTYWRVGAECLRGAPYSGDTLLSLTMGDKGISAIAVFRLAATNMTMFPPGAAIPNPITYVPGTTPGGEEHMGKRGWWLLTVTHAVTNKTSPSEAGIQDEKAWVWGLIAHGNGTSRWVPVAGNWRLYMAQDWDPSRYIKDLPGGVKIMEWNQSTIAGFPKVHEPQTYRDWHLITLSAWRTQIEELGQGYSTAGVWLTNGSTLALYNVTFTYMGVTGNQIERVFWQPIAVSTFALRAEARYALESEREYDPRLGRRRIRMYIHANVTWKYEPPASWQRLGFRVHPPQLGFTVSLEEPGCTSTACIGYWTTSSKAGPTWRLYIIGLGDTEDFYSSAHPRGLLGGDGYSSVRDFRLSIRWLGAGNHPTTLVWGSDRISFRMAPATVYKLDWTDPQGPFTATYGCFAQGPSGLTPLTSYTADLTFDWGLIGSTHPLRDTRSFAGVNSPYTVDVPVPRDDWIAFYFIPAGGKFPITEGAIVPVPLVAKYPPRG